MAKAAFEEQHAQLTQLGESYLETMQREKVPYQPVQGLLSKACLTIMTHRTDSYRCHKGIVTSEGGANSRIPEL